MSKQDKQFAVNLADMTKFLGPGTNPFDGPIMLLQRMIPAEVKNHPSPSSLPCVIMAEGDLWDGTAVILNSMATPELMNLLLKMMRKNPAMSRNLFRVYSGSGKTWERLGDSVSGND